MLPVNPSTPLISSFVWGFEVPIPKFPVEGINPSGWARVEMPRIDVEAPDTKDRYWNWGTTEVEILRLPPPPPPP